MVVRIINVKHTKVKILNTKREIQILSLIYYTLKIFFIKEKAADIFTRLSATKLYDRLKRLKLIQPSKPANKVWTIRQKTPGQFIASFNQKHPNFLPTRHIILRQSQLNTDGHWRKNQKKSKVQHEPLEFRPIPEPLFIVHALLLF
jgi:hypothetical protein